MKRTIRNLAVMTVCMLMYDFSIAQDIHFSQFYENAILRNPGLTGIFSGDYKAGVNYRNQWSSISVPFQTGLASIESRIPVSEETGDNFSFGVTLTYDHAGSINFNSFQAYPAINYNKALEDKRHSYISAGFAVGYIQRSYDPNQMKFATQYSGGTYNPNNPSNDPIINSKAKMSYIDVGAGVSFNSTMGKTNNINYYLGAAAYHVNKPKAAFNRSDAFLRMDVKWIGNLGLLWAINPQIGLTFHSNYSLQGPNQEVIAGFLGSWKKMDGDPKQNFVIYGGVFYRYQDAVIPTVKLDYNKYSFTVSYDLNTSSLRTASNGLGGVEISVFTRGVLTKGPWAQSKIKCPRFEDMPIQATE